MIEISLELAEMVISFMFEFTFRVLYTILGVVLGYYAGAKRGYAHAIISLDPSDLIEYGSMEDGYKKVNEIEEERPLLRQEPWGDTNDTDD